jgi:hypothetical protein
MYLGQLKVLPWTTAIADGVLYHLLTATAALTAKAGQQQSLSRADTPSSPTNQVT